ncbi:MAG TPA: crossover junction endodeoxyribonuclease RuvC [Candidatus Paceibacterota bacterium]
MIILGVDPGSSRIGYGAIEYDREPSLLRYGTLEIISRDPAIQIQEAVQGFSALLKELQPALVAVEKIYFAKNRKTGIAVAQTRGALIAEIQKHGLRFREYDPTTIKKTVAGYGHADKKAIAKMVCISLKIPSLSGHDDASDALAVALTAAYHHVTDDLN